MGITTRISLEVAVEVSAKRSRIAVATLPSKIQISGKNLRSAPPRSPVIDQDPSQETERNRRETSSTNTELMMACRRAKALLLNHDTVPILRTVHRRNSRGNDDDL